MLGEAGTDVNAMAAGGWTPLHLTVKAGDKDMKAVVELLVAHGVDVKNSLLSGP